jgi:hypothetical protein
MQRVQLCGLNGIRTPELAVRAQGLAEANLDLPKPWLNLGNLDRLR